MINVLGRDEVSICVLDFWPNLSCDCYGNNFFLLFLQGVGEGK